LPNNLSCIYKCQKSYSSLSQNNYFSVDFKGKPKLDTENLKVYLKSSFCFTFLSIAKTEARKSIKMNRINAQEQLSYTCYILLVPIKARLTKPDSKSD